MEVSGMKRRRKLTWNSRKEKMTRLPFLHCHALHSATFLPIFPQFPDERMEM